MYSLLDSHAHLTEEGMFPNLSEILSRAKTAHVDTIINICTDEITLQRGLELVSNPKLDLPKIYNVAATTPHDAQADGERLFPFFEGHARAKHLVAIGETGLDYHYYKETKETQKKIFRKYLQLALECKLPVVIHCREAFDDFFEILDSDYNGPGVLHCFTGTLRDAEKLLERGWYLSLSGIVTYKQSQELREVAKKTPLNRLLIETDSPYLAPQTKRGKKNEPSFLVETASLIADLKQISLEELSQHTRHNGMQLFQRF